MAATGRPFPEEEPCHVQDPDGARLAALFLSTSASAQGTCRAADITCDGVVNSLDFVDLSVCFGQPVDVPLPQG